MILALFLSAGFLYFAAICGVLIYRSRALGAEHASREATKSANYNAALWAESEALRHETLLENARLSVTVEILEKHYNQISDLAKQAIRFQAERNGLDPDEVFSDDSILGADHLG